ncbi:MAG: hypothetical protein PHF21_01120, partial [Bacilli bacterium]|nr:hypothetical protein [Bacilli bacterium]
DNFSGKELINITIQDFSKIMEIMGEQNIAELTEKFSESIEIIKLYKSVIKNTQEIEETPQYDDCLVWLNKIAEVIFKHINTFEKEQIEHIKILENSANSLREVADLFKAGKLIKPIYNMAEFHDLLNKSGFDLSTKVAIKKAIGQNNYNLIIEKPKKVSKIDSKIKKYKTLFEEKFLVHKNVIKIINDSIAEQNITLSIEKITEQQETLLKLNTGLSSSEILNSILCILLERVLESYEEHLSSDIKDEIFNHADFLLKHFDENMPKEEIENKNNKDTIVIEAENLIEQAAEIIDREKHIIRNNEDIKIENYYNLAANNDIEGNELTLSIIINSIAQCKDLLTNILKEYIEEPTLFIKQCKEQILNLNDYIETYHIVKKRLELLNNSKKI